jgi:hypothetical protein
MDRPFQIGDKVWIDCPDTFGPGKIVDITKRFGGGTLCYRVRVGDDDTNQEFGTMIDPFGPHELFREEIPFQNSVFKRENPGAK